MPATPNEFRAAMSRFATGVTVVTGADASGEAVGFTANSVASVSLVPPLVLVCADRDSASLPTLIESGRFAISVLRAEDEEIAVRFAQEIRGERFREIEFSSSASGTPVLAGSLAWLDCHVWKTLEAGDHVIIIGRVDGCDAEEAGRPLVFFRGEFGTTAR